MHASHALLLLDGDIKFNADHPHAECLLAECLLAKDRIVQRCCSCSWVATQVEDEGAAGTRFAEADCCEHDVDRGPRSPVRKLLTQISSQRQLKQHVYLSVQKLKAATCKDTPGTCWCTGGACLGSLQYTELCCCLVFNMQSWGNSLRPDFVKLDHRKLCRR